VSTGERAAAILLLAAVSRGRAAATDCVSNAWYVLAIPGLLYVFRSASGGSVVLNLDMDEWALGPAPEKGAKLELVKRRYRSRQLLRDVFRRDAGDGIVKAIIPTFRGVGPDNQQGSRHDVSDDLAWRSLAEGAFHVLATVAGIERSIIGKRTEGDPACCDFRQWLAVLRADSAIRHRLQEKHMSKSVQAKTVVAIVGDREVSTAPPVPL
jgi:hypothetical protein